MFITTAAEQFGTNIRATVTTTAPNFVRGAVVPLTLMFELFKDYTGIVGSAVILAFIVLIVAFLSLYNIAETFGKDIDYVEQVS